MKFSTTKKATQPAAPIILNTKRLYEEVELKHSLETSLGRFRLDDSTPTHTPPISTPPGSGTLKPNAAGFGKPLVKTRTEPGLAGVSGLGDSVNSDTGVVIPPIRQVLVI